MPQLKRTEDNKLTGEKPLTTPKAISATPPTEKPTEVQPPAEPEPEAPAEIKSNAGRESWKRLSQSTKEFREQAAQRTKDLEAAQTKLKEMEETLGKYSKLPVAPDEIAKAIEERDKLSKEVAEVIGQLETVKLQESPRFKNWWSSETKKHIDIVTRMVPTDKREEIAKLMLEPTSVTATARIDELLEGLGNSPRRMVERAWENLEALKAQREEALTKGSERYRELQAFEAGERQKQENAAKLRREQLATAALTKARNYDAFKPDPKDPDKAASITQYESFVQSAVRGELPEDLMLTMPGLAAQALYQQDKVIPGLRSELAKANELIKQLQGAGPKPSTGASGSAPALDQAPPGSEFAAKVKAAMTGSRTGV